MKIEAPEQIVPRGDTALLYVTTHRETADALKQSHRLIYSNLPDWLKKFNYNNWLDRTKFWYVYELN